MIWIYIQVGYTKKIYSNKTSDIKDKGMVVYFVYVYISRLLDDGNEIVTGKEQHVPTAYRSKHNCRLQ